MSDVIGESGAEVEELIAFCFGCQLPSGSIYNNEKFFRRLNNFNLRGKPNQLL
jgi:hypothetical protein